MKGVSETMSEVNMPRLSDTMQEGTIAHWLKKLGDEIKKGDILAEIETDKATMDLEAYEEGTLQKILVQEGETVPIGQAVALIGSGAADQTQAQTETSDAKTGADGAAAAPTKVASLPSKEANTQSSPAQGQEQSLPVHSSAQSTDRGTIKASPLARRIAEEHNIDLQQIQGTGPGGRIVRDDLEDFLEHRSSAPSTPAPTPVASAQEVPTPAAQPSAPPDAEVSKLSRVRLLIARRLTESKQTIPHFYVSSEIDMTDTLALRQTFNATAGEEGVKVTVNDMIVKACALALEKFPEVNSTIKEDQLIQYKHINVGIAVDVPSGLVVPVIRDTNNKGVRSIAREAKALIAKARENKLAPVDLEGGTFSVSNLGMMDVSEFIAVINPPQSAILAIASTKKQFVPIDGQPVIRDLMTVTMSADHRILYGAAVARFLQEVKRLLQNPYSLLG
ncbi:MAG TPA: pyruvate dehydrogenase complex dihydrolipoamide acetyltransferase [Ktedonobacter sp.]|jgi:pyruvate dehydrogenase E2 component (dihydrolipoamide acetyltransferase)|nr:pyruvate dehydrogenase complex dihydrolipoamide acetyltransferase [Ktedonobacter sp.]HAT44645.1 pyruvate dehydrogenase complex dihydrolipoamide acetyltransferase [Ktedonobacter sp.]HBE26272.1 pyruvate dehydrogenase complex dihydrolipoamide acetyltransferase [Ktedonobacter sp.]HBE27729.1 pyruvate dehydrogenase complex dihydrolipoamide acetyltransferase [Ktedonobacter sp.]HCF87661.1 pyruvate dehydrogenase complex dihydrolipoamide acetyltransferase [Ktedonobacter sp.]